MAELEMQRLRVGGLGTNCYLVMNKNTKEMLLVDPADQADRIMDVIKRMEGNPVAILLTHGHFDHIMAAKAIRDQYKIPVIAHSLEEEVLEDPQKNLSAMWAGSYSMKADQLTMDKEELDLAGFQIHVLHTPGHTQGSCCYHFPLHKVLLSGDTMFQGSYGRVDFPTSSSRDMRESIARLLREMPEDTDVFPGHESETTISFEKRYNPLA